MARTDMVWTLEPCYPNGSPFGKAFSVFIAIILFFSDKRIKSFVLRNNGVDLIFKCLTRSEWQA